MENIVDESIDYRIINLLTKLKYGITDYPKSKEFLLNCGYTLDEIIKIYEYWFTNMVGVEFTPLNWMLYNYRLETFEMFSHTGHPETILYKRDGKFLMGQDLKSRVFWFDYENVLLFLHNFDLSYNKIQDVMRLWIGDVSYRIDHCDISNDTNLSDVNKLKSYTPSFQLYGDDRSLYNPAKLESYVRPFPM